MHKKNKGKEVIGYEIAMYSKSGMVKGRVGKFILRQLFMLQKGVTMNFDEKIADQNLRGIWLAGGCFWGIEAYFGKINGVVETNVGYANGNTINPSYEEVCRSTTGHTETVFIRYDPARLDLETLLTYYFKVIDPTILNRQGNDRGSQYRTGIYYKDVADKEVIEGVVAKEQMKYSKVIVTEVLPLDHYYVAEEYHQKYLVKNPNGYCHIDLS